MKNRIDVINHIIAVMLQRGERHIRYLEIGCQDNVCFDAVDNRVTKVGVDPISGGTHRMTSNEFFNSHVEMFDVVFIDGDHRHPQVMHDIANALDHLRPGGAVVMHDCLPPSEEFESERRCGTVWRAFAFYRQHLDLNAIVGDFDYGVGIIFKGANPLPIVLPCDIDYLTYADLSKNRESWMRPHDTDGVRRFIESM